jgi:hypothetical protein
MTAAEGLAKQSEDVLLHHKDDIDHNVKAYRSPEKQGDIARDLSIASSAQKQLEKTIEVS